MVFPDFRRPALTFTWQRDPLFKEFRNVFTAEGLRSLVVVGLQIKERSCGALLVSSRAFRTFESSELRLMLAIGNQVSAALQNRYLSQAVDRRNEELRILHRVGEALRATFDLEVQAEILQREVRGLLGTTTFSLAFQDSRDGRLETVYAYEDGSRDKPKAFGLSEYVLRTRAPLMITHKFLEEARRLGVASVDPRIRTWCGGPINFSDSSMGVMAVADTKDEHTLNEERSEEHTSELQSLAYLVCRLLLEKKKYKP